MSSVVLYDHPGSPCARRVRITLFEKGLPFERRIVDLFAMEQKRPEYLALNPNGVVPTLVHGDRVVYESNVITEYLDDAFPEVRLYPIDPIERIRVREWQSFELAFTKDYRPLMYQRLGGVMLRLTSTLEEAVARVARHTADPAQIAWEKRVWALEVLDPAEEAAHHERLRRRLAVVESALAGHRYLVGDRFTQADISVYPRLRMYPYVQIAIPEATYPNVVAWMRRLEKRPSFAQSLSTMERRTQLVSRTGLISFLAGVLKKRAGERGPVERAALALARRFAAGTMTENEGSRIVHEPATRRPRSGVAPRASVAPPALRPLEALARDGDLVIEHHEGSLEMRQVEVALTELGLPFTRATSAAAGGPLVLRHGSLAVQHADVVFDYLDALTGRGRLFPRDSFQRAQALMWLAFEREIDKVIALGSLGATPGAGRALVAAEMVRRLVLVDRTLGTTAFLAGDAVTIADLVLALRLDALARAASLPSLAELPRIAKWRVRVSARDSLRHLPSERSAPS